MSKNGKGIYCMGTGSTAAQVAAKDTNWAVVDLELLNVF